MLNSLAADLKHLTLPITFSLRVNPVFSMTETLCLIALVSWLRLLSCVLIWRWEALISGIGL